MRHQIELCLPPDPRHLALARAAARESALLAGLGEERVGDLELAMTEALSNAFRAQRQVHAEAPVVLALGAVDDDHFEVCVTDEGLGFEARTAEQCSVAVADYDGAAEGGWGVALMRLLADEVEFVRESGMSVHLRFDRGGSR